MNDEEILGHLLKIEAEAAALVRDAQAEADRRVDEGEKQNRAAYDGRYRAEAARLEAEYQKEKEKVNDQYQKELEAYCEKLNAINADTGRFSASLEALLSGGTPGGGEA
jgi:F0F1-type ATP synthase membrane subunit b/b'